MTTAEAPGARAAIQQAVDRLADSARRHKRAEADHRRQAQDDLEALHRLEAMCRELGIKLVVRP